MNSLRRTADSCLFLVASVFDREFAHALERARDLDHELDLTDLDHELARDRDLEFSHELERARGRARARARSLARIIIRDRISSLFRSRSQETKPTAKDRSIHQARGLLNLASLVLPRKITTECFGDRFEQLEEMADSVPGWRLQLDALISIGWALIFTLKELGKPGLLLAAIWRLLGG